MSEVFNSNAFHVPFYRRRPFIIAVGVVGVLALVVGISVSSTKKETNTVAPRLPQVTVAENIFQEQKAELGATLIQRYDAVDMSFQKLYQESSPAGLALTFVAGGADYASYSQDQRVQRFALAVFYYATFGVKHEYFDHAAPAWKSSHFWISEKPECQWEGIVCDDNDSVVAIDLSERLLSGSIPNELGLLTNLIDIDLHSNLIMGQDDSNQVWKYMPQLEQLALDDNFIVGTSGIPVPMRQLVNLQKLSMSYNLLQGEMDGTLFADLQKLTHLELEANFVSGPIPPQIAQLPNIVYLYLRRNSLTLKLHEFLLPNTLPSIFALWLDENDVSGSIPNTIGQFADLKSLSVTGAQLTGTLPTELGTISMKRLWLYNNQLSGPIPASISNWSELEVLELQGNNLVGSMPPAVCSTIAQATYTYATLSADCQEVTCADCCTQCY